MTLLRSGEWSVNKQREKELLEKATNGAKALGWVVTEHPSLTQSREDKDVEARQDLWDSPEYYSLYNEM